ncbi:Uncharacterised protein [Mycobacteroides abscessus]|nr:Uncharacterised protein [Mycobacteroides abscessus]
MRSLVSGCCVVVCVATADTARVIARAYGAAAAVRSRALPMRDAAMSSCARNIFLSDCVDLIRCL